MQTTHKHTSFLFFNGGNSRTQEHVPQGCAEHQALRSDSLRRPRSRCAVPGGWEVTGSSARHAGPPRSGLASAVMISAEDLPTLRQEQRVLEAAPRSVPFQSRGGAVSP